MKAETIWSWIQICIAAIGGWLGWVLGGMDGFLYALIFFTAADYLTGIMCAIVEKKLSSEVGFRGIFKKVLIFVMVAVGNLVDTTIISSGDVVRTAVIFFYLSNEGVSILENASRIGLPVPEKLKEILIQIHNKGDKDNES
ncbi:MAG TPA: phage holin family protein [Ruminiclostridium sp.]